MDNLLISKKRHIIPENNEEFYLNPRDLFINGKLSSLHSVKYHITNELLSIFLEDFILFIDLKVSVCDSLKIIKSIKYSEINNLLDINNISNIINNSIYTNASNTNNNSINNNVNVTKDLNVTIDNNNNVKMDDNDGKESDFNNDNKSKK